MSNLCPYTYPKLVKGSEWYIYVSYLYLGKWHPFRFKGTRNAGLNNRKFTYDQRIAISESLINTYDYMLRVQGWNPVTQTFPPTVAVFKEIEELQAMGFSEAVDFAISKVDAAKKTIQCYKGTVRMVKRAADECQIAETPIRTIKRVHVMQLFDRMQILFNLSNHAYNKHMGYFKAIVDRLIRYNVIDNTPCESIKKKRVAEAEMYTPLTEAEKALIFRKVPLRSVHFARFLQFFYYTGIRPKEVLKLKVKDILENDYRFIKILPDLKRENSKVLKVRTVIISPHLELILREMRLERFDGNDFLFGYASSYDMRSLQSIVIYNKEHPLFFAPSPHEMNRDTATKTWELWVKKELKINKHMYALKHTAANDMLNAGISLDAVQNQLGHSTKGMTKVYAKVAIQTQYTKEIRDLAPAFVQNGGLTKADDGMAAAG